MLEKIIEYCKDNLPLVAVVAACVIVILIAIIALCAKKAKAKKSAEPQEMKPAPLSAPTQAPAVEPAPLSTPVEEKKEEKEKTIVKKLTPPTTVKEQPTIKPVPEQETPAPEKKPTAKKSTRYTGKWVICRVVTAAHAEGNIHDESAEETFFFELRASNGEKLLTSEEYTTHSGALMGINTHKTNIEKGNFRITLSKKGDYIFKLLNGKNMLLCMGEH